MKNLADTLQRAMFDRFPSSHKAMNEVWLKHGETPQEVFMILRPKRDIDNTILLNWLRYTELYRAKKGTDAFSSLQAVHLLLEARPLQNEVELGKFFQLIKDTPELKKLAENMQTHLFSRWISVNKLDPKELGDTLDSYGTWRTILSQPKNDAGFQTLEAYTLQYAKDLGGTTVLERVKTLFAKNDPEAAIAAAMKASYPL